CTPSEIRRFEGAAEPETNAKTRFLTAPRDVADAWPFIQVDSTGQNLFRILDKISGRWRTKSEYAIFVPCNPAASEKLTSPPSSTPSKNAVRAPSLPCAPWNRNPTNTKRVLSW